MKSKKTFVSFAQVRRAIETNDGEQVFAVNMEQYKELAVLEGQSVIRDDGIGWIENVASRLKKCPRIRKNYIVTASE